MSNRLNQEREKILTPTRHQKALSELNKRNIEILAQVPESIRFKYNGKVCVYFPYSGWASGGSIKDGRGLKGLLRQLDA